MSHNIFILSAPIQSGKTTALMEFWESGLTSFDGFITPEIDESRKLIFLDTDEELPFELEGGNHLDSIEIGRFKFSKSTFEAAKQKFKSLHKTSASLIIIDELGKLEMDGRGFEPELGEFIEKFKLESNNKLLIIVIRNTLLAAAIEKY
ncbi:MAG: nucleoside-triphosphatase, partial [Chitinophagales bacterium]